MKRVTPTPAVPSTSSARASPPAADWRTDASAVNASSRPTNRALVNLAGMNPFYEAMHGSKRPGAAGAIHRGGHRLDYPSMVTEPRREPHPANTLNELPGEEWLYFTKSLLSTAYPTELGHKARRAHGANKPPRLMARLIEFFTRSGELVLDPFAGVGGTLLGAAIARGPRRAIGLELDPRWVTVFDETVAALSAEREGAGPLLADLGPNDPGGVRTFQPSALEMRQGDARELLRAIPDASIDFVATDPPYNVQLPMTMAGGKLAEAHANRRTDYAMVTDSP